MYVIPPFGVVLLVYPPDYPRARSARGGRADKPQHHDKRWNKMFITVDWSLLGNLRARARRRRGQVLPNTASACIRTRETGRETVPRDFVEGQRRGRMSWENSYSKKLPALTSLTLVVSWSLRKPRVRSVKRPATTARRGRVLQQLLQKDGILLELEKDRRNSPTVWCR